MPAKGLAMLQSVKSALEACQPYKMLPAEKYEEWKVLDPSFSPRDLAGRRAAVRASFREKKRELFSLPAARQITSIDVEWGFTHKGRRPEKGHRFSQY